MGLLNQIFRKARKAIVSAVSYPYRKLVRKRKRGMVTVPGSWAKTERKQKAFPTVIKYKKRLPGLRSFKRIIAAGLLLINFGLSQFLLGSLGSAQPMFILFLLNSWICIEFLWKTRRGEQ